MCALFFKWLILVPLWQFRLWPLDPATNRNIPPLASIPHFCFHLSVFSSIRYKFIPCSWLVVSCVIGCNVMTNVCWRLVLKIIAQHLLGAYSVPDSVITVLRASTKLIFFSHKVNAVIFCILGKRKRGPDSCDFSQDLMILAMSHLGYPFPRSKGWFIISCTFPFSAKYGLV